jgi:hypothetical protein
MPTVEPRCPICGWWFPPPWHEHSKYEEKEWLDNFIKEFQELSSIREDMSDDLLRFEGEGGIVLDNKQVGFEWNDKLL